MHHGMIAELFFKELPGVVRIGGDEEMLKRCVLPHVIDEAFGYQRLSYGRGVDPQHPVFPGYRRGSQSFEDIFPDLFLRQCIEEEEREGCKGQYVVGYLPHAMASAFSVMDMSACSSSILFFSISSEVLPLLIWIGSPHRK